jgi:hypothetical protein
MTSQDRVIRKLVKAAKQAMKEIDFAMPCTPLGDAWSALHSAVKAAEKLREKA